MGSRVNGLGRQVMEEKFDIGSGIGILLCGSKKGSSSFRISDVSRHWVTRFRQLDPRFCSKIDHC